MADPRLVKALMANGELRGTGPGESRDPYASTFEDEQAKNFSQAWPLTSVPMQAFTTGRHVADAVDRGLGWPDLAAIAASGIGSAVVPFVRGRMGLEPVTPGSAATSAALAGAGSAIPGALAGDTDRAAKAAGIGAEASMLGSYGLQPYAERALEGIRTGPEPYRGTKNLPGRNPAFPFVYRDTVSPYYPDMPNTPAIPIGTPRGVGFSPPAQRALNSEFYGDLYGTLGQVQLEGIPGYVQDIKKLPGVGFGGKSYQGPDGRFVSHEVGMTAERLGFPKKEEE